MKTLLLIIVGLIVLSVALTLLGPLIALAVGALLAYYSYKQLAKSDSALSTVWWILIGAAGVCIFVGALPGLIFLAAIGVVIYLVHKKSSSARVTKEKKSSPYDEFHGFEAEWRDVTNRYKYED